MIQIKVKEIRNDPRHAEIRRHPMGGHSIMREICAYLSENVEPLDQWCALRNAEKPHDSYHGVTRKWIVRFERKVKRVKAWRRVPSRAFNSKSHYRNMSYMRDIHDVLYINVSVPNNEKLESYFAVKYIWSN